MMKNLSRNIIIMFVFMILGFMFILQFKNVSEDYTFVTIRTLTELENSVNKEREELRNLRELIQLKENRLAEYQRALEEEGSIKDILLDEIQLMKAVGGFVDLEGPGIRVRISDSERELEIGENPNNVIVHDGDILAILNDLKAAGAEALSIRGQRIISTSEVICSDATIRVNNYNIGQPFYINAIGNPEMLHAAINAPDSYASFLREVYGIIVESEMSSRVKIPRYHDDIILQYGRPREGD